MRLLDVFYRDNHTCYYCGETGAYLALTLVRITPVSLGGTDEPDNLVTTCKECAQSGGWPA